MSQQRVADAVGVTNQYVSAIELGKHGLSDKMKISLAEIFCVSSNKIFQLECEYQAERTATLQAQGTSSS
jgi:DNA-binding XRE family transcriptional regulator